MTPDPRSQPDLATENARLRSANAKLVEALTEAAAAIEQMIDLDGVVERLSFDPYAIRDSARAAIAEAESHP